MLPLTIDNPSTGEVRVATAKTTGGGLMVAQEMLTVSPQQLRLECEVARRAATLLNERYGEELAKLRR